MSEWQYVGACFDGQRFGIDGANVWSHKWHSRKDELAIVIDPMYAATHTFQVWEIVVDGRTIVFAAGEFSNCVWGFYVPSGPAGTDS